MEKTLTEYSISELDKTNCFQSEKFFEILKIINNLINKNYNDINEQKEYLKQYINELPKENFNNYLLEKRMIFNYFEKLTSKNNEEERIYILLLKLYLENDDLEKEIILLLECFLKCINISRQDIHDIYGLLSKFQRKLILNGNKLDKFINFISKIYDYKIYENYINLSPIVNYFSIIPGNGFLIKFPQIDLSKYLTIVFSFKVLHFKQISTIFSAKKINEDKLFIISLEQKHLNFTLKEKSKILLGELEEGWNNLCIYIDRENKTIHLNLNKTNIKEERIPETNDLSEINLFGNFTGEVSSIYGYFKKGSMNIMKNNKNIILGKEYKEQMKFYYSFHQGTYEFKQGIFYIEEENNKINLLPYNFFVDNNENNIDFKEKVFYNDYQNRFLFSPFLYLNSNYEYKNIICDYYSFFNCKISKIIIHNYEYNNGIIDNLGGMNVLYPIFIILNNKEIRNEERVDKLLSIIINLLEKEDNLKSCISNHFLDLICRIFENWPLDFFTDKLFDKISKIFDMIDSKDEMNYLFSFYLPHNKKKILYMLNFKLAIFIIDPDLNNNYEKIKELLLIILRFKKIEISKFENNDNIINQIYILFNKVFEDDKSENENFIDEISLQFLYSFLLFHKKINDDTIEINIKENYLYKLIKDFYIMFKNNDFQNYKLEEENNSEKLLFFYIPILFVINIIFKNNEKIINKIREKVTFLLTKSLQNIYFKNPLLFNLMKGDFHENEIYFSLTPKSLIKNLCIKFPYEERKLFDYLFDIIKEVNEFKKVNENDPIITCQGDYFLFIIIMSIFTLDKNEPFFILFSKISFEYVKKLYKYLNEIKGKNREEVLLIYSHNQFIKNHLLLADSLLKFKNDQSLTENLFNGIFKDFSFDGQIIQNLVENEYVIEQDILFGEKYYLNIIKSKKMRKKIIKNLFTFNGYWSDKNLFFPNEEEENDLKNNQFKFKLKNYITNDLKKPILNLIIDYNEYLFEFNEKNEEVNEFYKKFSWFNHYQIKEENNDLYKKNIDEIINILFDNKKNIIFSILIKEMCKEIYSLYSSTLIKQGFEIECMLFIKKEKNNEYKIVFYTIEDDMKQPNNGNNFHFEILPCLKKLQGNLIEIKIENILMFYPRIYNYKKSGLEIFLSNGKNYYFVFTEEKHLNDIINFLTTKKMYDSLNKEIIFYKLINNLYASNMTFDINTGKINEINIIGYFSEKYIFQNHFDKCINIIQFKKLYKEKVIVLSKIVEKWKENDLSNYLMLMYLNIFANRSFCDISQYPIFPWIIKSNYEDNEEENINNNNSLFRDLTKPMGQIINNKRNNNFVENYIKNINNKKAQLQSEKKKMAENDYITIPVYLTNYSNPTYVSNFLYRIFPFNFIFNKCQEKKLVENEIIFSSIPFSFYNSSTKNINDIREIIPEFFYFCEMFQNINKIKNIEDVKLDNQLIKEFDDQLNPYFLYCKFLKENLEGEEISKNLNDWIDLIFGYCQKGEKSRKCFNTFRIESYIDILHKNDIYYNNIDIMNNIYKIGLIPLQLFIKNKFYQKNFKVIKYSVFHAIIQQNLIKIDMNNIIQNKSLNDNFYMESFGTSNYVFYNNYLCFNHNIKRKAINIINKEYLDFQGGKILIDFSFSEDNKCKNNYSNHAIYIKDNIYYSFNGGFFNGRISCFSYCDNKIESIKIKIRNINIDDNKIIPYITSLEIINNENLLISGNAKGDINIYNILPKKENNEITLKYIKSLYNHTQEIIYINYNKDLNLLISASKDGYINLYKINPIECIRTYKSPYNDIKFAFLISNPIPCIIIYASQYLFTFLLNNNNINEKIKSRKILNPNIIKSPNHEDLLMVSIENTITFFNPTSLNNQNKTITFPYNILTYCFNDDLNQIYGYCQNPISKDYYICYMKGKKINS